LVILTYNDKDLGGISAQASRCHKNDRAEDLVTANESKEYNDINYVTIELSVLAFLQFVKRIERKD
jgi:hypothetical protein